MLPSLLADGNVAVEVVEFLRAGGVDVVSVVERGWASRTDDELLAEARKMRRFVPTHDGDFGRLAVAEGHRFHGILFLRPGDDPPARVIAGLRPLLARPTDWTPPTIAVYHAGRLRIRRPARCAEAPHGAASARVAVQGLHSASRLVRRRNATPRRLTLTPSAGTFRPTRVTRSPAATSARTPPRA